ncbi:hypothetical protein PAXRUDRAFT_744744 [Paxillus rubicundulus Ve08.2h10]|uniref:Uncharacterized protein n=1 Tax=Paxillus rubicundulus Ve08.2h10 TaxID=930991 RepID=A0A0D0DQP2_9AGAM|nr:hypothetical protein PAXRUDRAFT_744744 [Paxillus rubicundulus Ve08.2h10]
MFWLLSASKNLCTVFAVRLRLPPPLPSSTFHLNVTFQLIHGRILSYTSKMSSPSDCNVHSYSSALFARLVNIVAGGTIDVPEAMCPRTASSETSLGSSSTSACWGLVFHSRSTVSTVFPSLSLPPNVSDEMAWPITKRPTRTPNVSTT